MSIEQIINQKIQKLPSSLKQEVLKFVEFLETKQVRKSQEKTTHYDEEKAWEVFLNLEKDAIGSQSSDISENHDSYLYSKE